jgi:purine-binding chemotaxis protein CheW
MTSLTQTRPAQLCTFWLDGLFFGVDVAHVQEVLRYQEMTTVPRAPRAVRGLINLRGQIVTAVDLRCRLGLPDRSAELWPMNVIVRSRGEVQSLLVDDIGDVMDTNDYLLEPVPPHLPGAIRDALVGVMSLPGTILLVLDPDRAVDCSTAPEPVGGTP